MPRALPPRPVNNVTRNIFWSFVLFEDALAEGMQFGLDNMSGNHWEEAVEVSTAEFLGSLVAPR